MRDITEGLLAWRARGEPFAVATVTDTWSSAPRPAGAVMAVSARGEALGSISGGCVEGETFELARQVIETGQPVARRFGVADDDAFAAGLTCGGVIEVFIEPVITSKYATFDAVLHAVRDQQPTVLATVTSGSFVGEHVAMDASGRTFSSKSELAADETLVSRMSAMLAESATGTVESWTPAGALSSASVFIQSFAPPPRMIVFGAIDFAAAVADVGKFLGYHVTVCDARGVFATEARFPNADRVVVDWPHRYLAAERVDENTALCVLTHDQKFDIPLLKVALETPARYIGVMGSRRTHAARLDALRLEGVPEWQLERLSAPIGLDLGARTPEETAVSVAAEIIAAKRGGTGMRLRERGGAIHQLT